MLPNPAGTLRANTSLSNCAHSISILEGFAGASGSVGGR